MTTIPLIKGVINILMLSTNQNSPKLHDIEQLANVKKYNYWESNEGVKVATVKCIASYTSVYQTFQALSSFFQSKSVPDYTIEVYSQTV